MTLGNEPYLKAYCTAQHPLPYRRAQKAALVTSLETLQRVFSCFVRSLGNESSAASEARYCEVRTGAPSLAVSLNPGFWQASRQPWNLTTNH